MLVDSHAPDSWNRGDMQRLATLSIALTKRFIDRSGQVAERLRFGRPCTDV
jgi:hypothetical protein